MNTIDLNGVALPSEDEQATNELGDCFDDFNIDFFAHLNNSTELIIRNKDNTNNMLHYHNKLRAIQKKHNSSKEIHAQQQQTPFQTICYLISTSTSS